MQVGIYIVILVLYWYVGKAVWNGGGRAKGQTINGRKRAQEPKGTEIHCHVNIESLYYKTHIIAVFQCRNYWRKK